MHADLKILLAPVFAFVEAVQEAKSASGSGLRHREVARKAFSGKPLSTGST
jgi:hypothetical protein